MTNNTYIIFNPFNLQCFLSAAVMKTNFNIPVNRIFTSVQSSPDISDSDDNKVFYIGCKPDKHNKHTNTINLVIDGNYETTGSYSNIYSTVVYQYIGSRKNDICNLVENFLTNNLTMVEMLIMYININNAALCLESDHEKFIPFNFDVSEDNRHLLSNFIRLPYIASGSTNELLKNWPALSIVKPDILEEFLQYIRRIKIGLEKQFSIQFVELKKAYFKTALTFYQPGIDYFWVERLIRISHKHHANVYICKKGFFVYTDLYNIDGLEIAHAKCIKV